MSIDSSSFSYVKVEDDHAVVSQLLAPGTLKLFASHKLM